MRPPVLYQDGDDQIVGVQWWGGEVGVPILRDEGIVTVVGSGIVVVWVDPPGGCKAYIGAVYDGETQTASMLAIARTGTRVQQIDMLSALFPHLARYGWSVE